MTLEAYDPRMIEAWKRGAIETVTLTFRNRRLATRFRQRMYELRVKLNAEQHEAAASANRASIRILEPDPTGQTPMLVEPFDSIFDDALSSANLSGAPATPEIDFDE